MLQIPSTDKKFSQPNTSDLFGNIWYSKNINFSEEGYAKLASRAIQLISEKDNDHAGIPFSFGRLSGEFHVVTEDSAFDINIAPTNFSISEDNSTNNPTLTFDSWGVWFMNRWHASLASSIWYETSTGSGWTDTGLSLNAGKVHCLEVFVNKSRLVYANGNSAVAVDSSYGTPITVTIPADYEIVGLKYSVGQMGIVTRPADAVAGQNKEALFFPWDGASSEAGKGYGVGSDCVMAIVAYKSSWVILTREGELKYFNGGGWTVLATLSFFYNKKIKWGNSTNREMLGDVLSVEGENIYINLGNNLNNFGKKGENYLRNNPAGVLCWDPKIGLTHRYSPSISQFRFIQVLSAGINTTTNKITKNSGTIPETGNPIKQIYDVSNAVGGISLNTIYYIIKYDANTFALAATKEDALTNTPVDLTSAADANFLAVDVLDYGQSKVGRSGGIAFIDTPSEMADHVVFGSELFDSESANDFGVICVTVPGFENRGSIVTAKAVATGVEDEIEKVYVKHRPMKKYDKIILKQKRMDVLGLPVTNPQNINTTISNWTSNTEFTTTADISEAMAYLAADEENELEVEILSGAGAGQMVQVESIELNAGVYTVTVEEEIDGVFNGSTSYIIIDNWQVLKTTNEESSISVVNMKGWEEFPISKTSKWSLFKIEFRGDETTLEEAKIINKNQIEE